jgi:hypothetical protein
VLTFGGQFDRNLALARLGQWKARGQTVMLPLQFLRRAWTRSIALRRA